MNGYKAKSTILISVIITIFVTSAIAIEPMQTGAIKPYFTLVFKTNSGGVRPDYGNFLQQQCARIGIKIDVIITWWGNWLGELIAFRDFDICYVALSGGGADPDFTGVYNENGSLNVFGYHIDMDYDKTLGTGKNEWYMRQGNLIMPPDSEERVQHYWDWEQYLMDKILPCQPTFAPKSYVTTWSNLNGYNFSDGFLQSWGKMSWTGSHVGQASTNEIVITDAAWSDLNPLFQDDTSSILVSKATMDPLIWYDSDLSVWPHLAESYTMLNDTTLEITTREGIPWGDDPDGLFTDEEFDIEDVYFTLYAWKYLSNDQQDFQWIEDMEIIDPDTMRIYIDGDPDTPENEPYAPFLPAIAISMLPEHFLNQTQDVTGKPDVTDSTWNSFATGCFGTGLFKIDTFKENDETILAVRDDPTDLCWRLNTSITNDPALNWVARFGDYTGGLDALRIRIIPDQQTALFEFEAGKVDIEDVTAYPNLRNNYIANPNFNVQNDTTFNFGFFGYNMRPVRPIIGNPNPTVGDPSISIGLAVRKAISYALDREEMNNIIHGGEFTIIDHPIYKKMGIWCNPNIIRYNHDLDKAREYMSLLGYETIVGPGFSLVITISSLMIVTVTSIFIIKNKKPKVICMEYKVKGRPHYES
ncbi:MAG: ABC transporter substrate-binding protein [Candidatus Heimdallarchaeota archaeon]